MERALTILRIILETKLWYLLYMLSHTLLRHGIRVRRMLAETKTTLSVHKVIQFCNDSCCKSSLLGWDPRNQLLQLVTCSGADTLVLYLSLIWVILSSHIVYSKFFKNYIPRFLYFLMTNDTIDTLIHDLSMLMSSGNLRRWISVLSPKLRMSGVDSNFMTTITN